MIYFLYGDQYPTLKKQLKKLKEMLLGDTVDEFNYVSLSAKEVPVQDIVSEASKPALFSPKKMIVIFDPYFLTTSKEKVDIEKIQDYEVLKKYLENPAPYTDLVFFLEGSNISTRSEIYKKINKYGTIQEAQNLTNDQLNGIGMQYFKKRNVEISNDAFQELLYRCDNDLAKFTMEANKLCLYSSKITKEDVENMVSLKLEQNAFAIAENLIQGNTERALKIYYDLRILKEEPVRLIALMASQFRILTEVGYLSEKGNKKDKDSIAKVMAIHPYRVQLALQNLNFIHQETAKAVLDQLYDLDYKIKSGQIDPYFGFELFLLNFKEISKKRV